MSLTHTDPLANLRFFEDAFTRMLSEPRTARPWSPAVDIYETDNELVFKADLPEMRKEDVKVTIENGVLYISGERKTEKEEKRRKFHRLERFFGTFERTFTVPEDADATKIMAEFHDGVLQVHLPKRPMPKPKAIEVKVQ